MLLRRANPLVLVSVSLYLSLAFAGALGPLRRQEPPATTSLAGRTSSTGSRDGSTRATGTASVPTGSSENSTTATSTLTSSSLSPAVTSGGTTWNDTLFNLTIPAGELPLEPRITAGWGVAGVILLGTGVVYALIGIKAQWLHTFFSTAYLSSLGTTVLIVYVMTPPISDGIQGAYVVAAVLTGAVLGGLAVVFREVTECLACLLGGFCFSMWMLTLQEGGLLTGTGAKVGLIASFSLAAFLCYFSRWTRTYALIGSISFSGATAAVLGIDAFSRAGLKEFWAYIWGLNEHLFPLGAATYPLTRGIRVEIAITVIVFLAGIVSQLKLWILIKQHREKRDAAKQEARLDLDREEAAVGRDIEEANAAERREWEAVYGDGDGDGDGDGRPAAPGGQGGDRRNSKGYPRPSTDSGVGDLRSEKTGRKRGSHGGTTTTGSKSSPHSIVEQPIEMSDMASEGGPPSPPMVPPKSRAAVESVLMHDASGMVTVRVGADDAPPVLMGEKGGEMDMPSAPTPTLRRSSRRITSSLEPVVVPLPFRVPVSHEDALTEYDDRSSVGALMDDDDQEKSVAAIASKRNSLAKRLSRSSAELLRSFSQRSRRSTTATTAAGDGGRQQHVGESREELVPSRSTFRDDRSSVAATIDGLSSDEEEEDTRTVRDGERPRGIEITAALGVVKTTKSTAVDAGARPTEDNNEENKEGSKADVSANDVPEHVTTQKAKSTKSAASVDSTPVSLSKEKLPRALSRIAMSYRTNEWAKHLSHAETPEPDMLRLEEYREEDHNNTAQGEIEDEGRAEGNGEAPAPVNVDELQQTAENGAPPPATIPRSGTAMSSYSQQLEHHHSHNAPATAVALARANSRQSVSSLLSSAAAGNNAAYRSVSGSRRTSGGPVAFPDRIAEESDPAAAYPSTAASSPSPPPQPQPHSGRTSVSPSTTPVPTPERSASTTSLSRPPVPGVVSYSSPQTLIGKREMFLRHKSTFGIPAAEAMPTIQQSRPPSEASFVGATPPVGSSPYVTSPGGSPVDADDIPLSKRRELMMRQNSLLSLSSSSPTVEHQQTLLQQQNRSSSSGFGYGMVGVSPAAVSADSVAFNSHQPLRGSQVPSAAAREAQLASFRSSVAADLRAGTPVNNNNGVVNGNNYNGNDGIATPVFGLGGMNGTSMSAMGYYNNNNGIGIGTGREARDRETAARRESDAHMQQSIDAQRSFLMGQKEAEAQRREAERLEKERSDRAFEEMMRRGPGMLDAHRDAMRRMQASARDS